MLLCNVILLLCSHGSCRVDASCDQDACAACPQANNYDPIKNMYYGMCVV